MDKLEARMLRMAMMRNQQRLANTGILTTGQKVRIARKLFRDFADKNNKDYEMSVLMVPEFTGEIGNSFLEMEIDYQQKILKQLGLTEKAYVEELQRIAWIERKFVPAVPWCIEPPAFNDMIIYNELL